MKAKFNNKSVLVTGALLVLSSAANAGVMFPTEVGQVEIQACVDEVKEGANFEDAMFVRHDVESRELRSARHELTIDTKVYGDDGVLREYRAVCFVRKGDAPSKFRMKEVESRS